MQPLIRRVAWGGLPVVLALACGAAGSPVAANPAAPQQGESAERLLERAIAWQGGRERLAATRYLKVPALKFTLHGAEGGTNEGQIACYYALATAEAPDKVRLKIDHGAGTRTMGFDGISYWIDRQNFNAFLSRERADDREDIERLDEARDILRVLFLPALVGDGEPFVYAGSVRRGDDVRHILHKKDAKGRRVSLHLGEDGAVFQAARREERREKDKFGDEQLLVRELVVLPSDFVTIDGVRLPRKIEVQTNGKPIITCQVAGDTPYALPADLPGRTFEKPEPRK